MSHFDVIAFDADDTLWHTERLYVEAQAKFVQLLSHYHAPEWIQERLDETEGRNLAHFGFGIKAFALSMIETAVELTEGRVSGSDIGTLVNMARDMLNAEVQLLENVADTIAQVAQRYPLMLITKGDLLDQENKIARSGLAHFFPRIEIVSHKTPESYARLLTEHNLRADRFVMVGNSIKSDILPVLEIGSSAVHVPYELTWLHEHAEPPTGHPRFYQIERIERLPALLQHLEQNAT